MAVDLVLSDDWELRGDGSGNPRVLQFGTARRLMDLYEQHGFRGTFNVEVMQQLAHREWAGRYPHLGMLAREWDERVREMRQRGHDVQLHVHPQWLGARYDGVTWRLQTNWSIIEYPEADVRRMLFSCQDYLQSLLRQDDPAYRCRSFRSGSWSLAPSPFVLSLLAEMGITFDMSMGKGLHYDLPMVRIDYRRLDESFLPYYPQMTDARRMAEDAEPIVCVPTHSRHAGISRPLRQFVERRLLLPVLSRLRPDLARANLLPPCHVPVEGDETGKNYGSKWSTPDSSSRWRRLARALRKAPAGKDLMTDISLLGYADCRAALKDAVRRARQAGATAVPVIFENHTKNLGNFAPLENFCRLLADSSQVSVITAAQLADRLDAGEYAVRHHAAHKSKSAKQRGNSAEQLQRAA